MSFGVFDMTWYFCRRSTASGAKSKEKSVAISGGLVKEKFTSILESYVLGTKVLGRGASAEVILGINNNTNREYAVKRIDIKKDGIAWRYEREKKIMKDIDHPNCIRLFEVYKNIDAHYFVMELCTGGHLGQALRSMPDGRFDVPTARRYITQIVSAISHCHKVGICHRDIKLQNILLESNNVDAQIKVIDFGNAQKFIGCLPLTKVVGTTYTAAPEVFRECYDERCDVWSIGVVAYILLSGRRPFESLDIPKQPQSKDASMIASILMGRYHFMHETWEDVDSVAISFVQTCLEMDYKKRKTSGALLEHSFIAYSNNLHDTFGKRPISEKGAKILSRQLSRNLSSGGFRRASMAAVAFQMPAQKASMLRSLFQEIDKDGLGTVDIDEFKTAMKSVDPTLSQEEIGTLFDAMDLDGDGEISFIEFVAATIDPREVDYQELNQAFRLLDADGKGYITTEDLQRVLETSNVNDMSIHTASDKGAASIDAGRNISFDSDGGEAIVGSFEREQKRKKKLNARITQIVEKADINNDGVISYTEFLFAMASNNLSEELEATSSSDTSAEKWVASQRAPHTPNSLHFSASILKAEVCKLSPTNDQNSAIVGSSNLIRNKGDSGNMLVPSLQPSNHHSDPAASSSSLKCANADSQGEMSLFSTVKAFVGSLFGRNSSKISPTEFISSKKDIYVIREQDHDSSFDTSVNSRADRKDTQQHHNSPSVGLEDVHPGSNGKMRKNSVDSLPGQLDVNDISKNSSMSESDKVGELISHVRRQLPALFEVGMPPVNEYNNERSCSYEISTVASSDNSAGGSLDCLSRNNSSSDFYLPSTRRSEEAVESDI